VNRLEQVSAIFREIGIVQERVEVTFKKNLPAHLPAAQFKLLNHLIFTTNKDETASDLATNSQVSLSAMSQVIKQLRLKGYIELKAQTHDSRKNKILITQAGHLAHQQAFMGLDSNLETLAKRFSSADLETLYRLSKQFRCEIENLQGQTS
jgi:DNA-binding MarR family transcriptional regulator